MSNSYKCFFISPIGDKDSPQRRNSDLVLKLIIQPALAQCGFPRNSIIRSDLRASSDKPIMLQVEEYLKGVHLCVADLTGLNPNVLYEFGYRKGMGRPVIVLASHDTDLPFDFKGELIVRYDIKDVLRIVETVSEVERQARDLIERKLLDEKYGSRTDIFDRLGVIEQKLDLLATYRESGLNDNSDAGLSDDSFEINDPQKAFSYYLNVRDVVKAERVIPRIAQLFTQEELVQAVSPLAAIGSIQAAAIIRSNWGAVVKKVELHVQIQVLSAYISYSCIRNIEPMEFEFIDGEISRLKELVPGEAERASVLNQENRICYGMYQTLKAQGKESEGYLSRAIDALHEAISLEPDEAAYYFNLAVCFYSTEQIENAKDVIEKCLELNTEDYDHLVLAYKIYRTIGDQDKCTEINKKLLLCDKSRWAKDKRLIDLEISIKKN